MKSIAESTSGNASLLFKNWPMFSIFVDFFKRIFFPFLLSFFLSFSSIVNSLHNFGEFLQFRFHCRIKVRIQNKFLYTIFLFFFYLNWILLPSKMIPYTYLRVLLRKVIQLNVSCAHRSSHHTRHSSIKLTNMMGLL